MAVLGGVQNVTLLLQSEPTDSRELEVEAIIQQYEKLQPATIQLVDELKNDALIKLRQALPQVRLVQVIHVLDESSIDEAIEKSTFVDALLLDSGNPNLAVKTLGGTGNTHNWQISKKIVEAVSKPVWLAGGLRPSNVQQAIEEVGPYGLDLCSGVRSNGRLDASKLEAFFTAVRAAS